MWVTVLVMAIALMFEPVRIGLTVMMLNRPRPVLQLLTFWCGGFAMGVSVGLVVLFALRHTLPASTNFALPQVQILIGVLALALAAVLATNISARRLTRGRLAGVAIGSRVDAAVARGRRRRVSSRGCPRAHDICCRAAQFGSRACSA
jgi:hypothetical protein